MGQMGPKITLGIPMPPPTPSFARLWAGRDGPPLFSRASGSTLVAGGGRKKPYNASIMRCPTTAAMLALIAGCAQLEWLRPDTEPATLNEDLARCEQQARLSASRMSPPANAIPNVSVSPSGDVSVQMPPPYVPSDLVRENDLRASCMRAKGYRLVPAKSAGGH